VTLYDVTLWHPLEFGIRRHRDTTHKSKVKREMNSLLVPNNPLNIFSEEARFQALTLSCRGLYHPAIATSFVRSGKHKQRLILLLGDSA